MTTPREQELEADILARHMELEAMAQEVARARASERCALAEVKALTAKLVQLQSDIDSLGATHVLSLKKLGAQEEAIKRARKVCEVSQPRGGSIGAIATGIRRYADALDDALATLNAPWEEAAPLVPVPNSSVKLDGIVYYEEPVDINKVEHGCRVKIRSERDQ